MIITPFCFTVVTIFLGIRLDGVDAALYAMIAYCVVVGVVIVFEVYLSMKKDNTASYSAAGKEYEGKLSVLWVKPVHEYNSELVFAKAMRPLNLWFYSAALATREETFSEKGR